MKSFIKYLTLMLAAAFLPLSACATDYEIEMDNTYSITLTCNGRQAKATMVANKASEELKALLENGSIYVSMSDYGGFEKVGPLPQNFSRNDRPTTTSAGDIVLYQGNQLVIFYGSNSWNYTPLGRINGMNASEIKAFLGTGSITLEISLAGTSGISNIEPNEKDDETEYYDLSGRKVTANTRGVILKRTNGKISKIIRY